MQGCQNTLLKVALWRWQTDEFDEAVTAENEENSAEIGQSQFCEMLIPYEETRIY
jgi:hypothetical protein